MPLECKVNRPILYLSEQEKAMPPQVEGPYWVICSGVKQDFTVKAYGHDAYQAVIDATPDIQWVQVGERHHGHRPLRGVVDLLGQTNARQLIRLCFQAQGGLGGESFLHHIFAALQKPFVCLASGFLPPSWVQYPTTTILHRHGKLQCCATRPCWKSRVVALGDGSRHDKKLCLLPVLDGPEPVPRCLDLIPPSEVAAAIRSYGGVL